jgi:hypothetical protein
MDALTATYGTWSTRFAPQITVLRAVVNLVGYANMHAANAIVANYGAVHAATFAQIAMR